MHKSGWTVVGYIALLLLAAHLLSGCVFVAMGAMAAYGIGKAVNDAHCEPANNLCEGDYDE